MILFLWRFWQARRALRRHERMVEESFDALVDRLVDRYGVTLRRLAEDD